MVCVWEGGGRGYSSSSTRTNLYVLYLIDCEAMYLSSAAHSHGKCLITGGGGSALTTDLQH